jgi:hypothetical protein
MTSAWHKGTGLRSGFWKVGAALFVLAGMLAVAPAASASSLKVTPPDQASTSSRGVSKTEINVMFPVVNLQALSLQLGFEGDVEYTEQGKAITLFVDYINDHGGINGRKIHADIQFFNPESDANMDALCRDWTEGSPAAFAVLDGVGDWSGDPQLCITQQGHTPFLAQWTTVSDWTTAGSPYLWWTGPDDAAILQAVVSWGHSSGLLGGKRKVAIIAGDRATDQLALNQYLLPDLKRIGVTPMVQTIAANPSEAAETGTEAPIIIEKLKAAGVNSVIPLMPFNAFLPILVAEGSQHYYPRLLLSDYEESIESSLGLIPVPFEKELNGQEGVTTETLGGVDDDRPQAQGGYDPGVRSCWKIWHKAYPQVPKGNLNFYIEEQGPVQGWCQEIDLFAKAATMAGRNLNRRTFVEAMSRITNYPGGYAPVFSFGPDKFFGPTEYQVVSLHNNHPPSAMCHLPRGHLPPQGVCWHQVQGWRPLPKVS